MEINEKECEFYSKVDSCCHLYGNPLDASPCGYTKKCYYKQLQYYKYLYKLMKLLADDRKNTIKRLQQKLDKINEICDKAYENNWTFYELKYDIQDVLESEE